MKQRLEVLTALRFPAAMLVFLHHVDGHFGIPSGAFQLRGISVSFFFVLSGFLLYLIYSRQDRPFSTIDFYWRRAIRIYPLHLAVLLISFAFLWNREIYLFSQDAASWFMQHGLRAALLQCWYPDPELMSNRGVTWSLSVLLFCYVAFPWLLKCRKFLWGVLLAQLSVCFVALWLIHDASTSSFAQSINPIALVHYSPPFRLAEFIVGMIAAQCYLQIENRGIEKNRGQVPFAGIPARRDVLRTKCTGPLFSSFVDAFVIASCILLWSNIESAVRPALQNDHGSLQYSLSRWFLYIGFAIPSGLILVWFARSTGYLAQALNHSVLVFLGHLSFAFFLCHRPIILWCERMISPWEVAPAVATSSCLCLVLMVSTVLYYFVERPSASWLRRKDGHTATARPVSPPQRGPINQFGGWLLMVTTIVIFFVFLIQRPTIEPIQFGNGIRAYIYGVVERNNHLAISLAWHTQQPVNGKLVAFHTTDLGEVVKRTNVATFNQRTGASSAGFKQFGFQLDESMPDKSVKLAFLEPGSRNPVLIRGDDREETSYHTVWSSGPQSHPDVCFQNGLTVNIDRMELLDDVWVIDLNWRCRSAIDGHLFLRQLDRTNQAIRTISVSAFSIAGSQHQLSGRKRLFINFAKYPSTQSFFLAFGQHGRGLIPLESQSSSDGKRVFLWNRAPQVDQLLSKLGTSN